MTLQAFLEMADETVATSMVSYFANGSAQLRGRSVYVQFSNHKELKTDQTHSNAVSGPIRRATGLQCRLSGLATEPT